MPSAAFSTSLARNECGVGDVRLRARYRRASRGRRVRRADLRTQRGRRRTVQDLRARRIAAHLRGLSNVMYSPEGSVKFLKAAMHTTKSNDASANGIAEAFPWRTSTTTPLLAAFSRAMRTN